MKKLILALMICLPLSLQAEGNGGYAGAALRMGLGARALAMGNAGIADYNGGYAFYYNPALSAAVKNKTISLSSRSMSLDRFSNFIGFTMPAPPDAGFSIGWLRSGVDNLYSVNSIGQIGEQIDHSINAAYFNFSRPVFGKFAIGVSVKYMWENLNFNSEKYFSSGWGWEVGTLYNFNKRLTLAFVVRDIASELTANTADLYEFGGTTVDKFPLTYVAGLRYVTPWSWLRVVYDLEASNKNALHNHIGAEALYQNALALRMGYETRFEGNRFSIGGGINFRTLQQTKGSLISYLGQLDYVFLPGIVGEGSTHVFSWQIYLD